LLKDYVRLNQSMFAAFAVSIVASAAVAEALSEQAPHLNTTYTTITDYVAYLGVFGFLFYLSNRHKYHSSSNSGTGRANLRSDLKKILASLGVGEVIYGAVRWLLQYYLLTVWQYDPYVTSIMSQAAAIAVYVVFMNLSAKMTRLFGNNGRV